MSEIPTTHKKQSNMFILTIFLLSLLIEIQKVYFNQLYSINIVFSYAIMTFGFIYLLQKTNAIKNKKAFIFLIPITLITLSSQIVFVDDSNLTLNVIILPIMITTFFILLTNTNYQIKHVSVWWPFKLFPVNFINNFLSLFSSRSKENNHSNRTKNIILGLLVALPLAWLIIILLTSADYYFYLLITHIINYFVEFIENRSLYHLVSLLVCFLFYYSVFINIYDHKDALPKSSRISYFNPVMIKTILIVLNTVFTLFLISELSKLNNNFLQLPVDYTYASYARESFFQLLFIAGINYFTITTFKYLDKQIYHDRKIKLLTIILISHSLLLILNSFYRMMLYHMAYGFTVLRVQVILFLVMTLFMFIIMLVKIFKDSLQDKLLIIINLSVFYILNLYLATRSFVSTLQNIFFNR